MSILRLNLKILFFLILFFSIVSFGLIDFVFSASRVLNNAKKEIPIEQPIEESSAKDHQDDLIKKIDESIEFNIPSAIATPVAPDAAVSGRLRISAPLSAQLEQINIDDISDAGIISLGQIDSVIVTDTRPQRPGWTVTMTCSDLVAGPNVIRINNLTVMPQGVQVSQGGSLSGITVGTAHTFINSTDPALLMSAQQGYGRGTYQQKENLKLFIDVATAPNTYSSTCVITVQ